MNTPEIIQHRTKVSLPDMLNKVKRAEYVVLPDRRTTICILTMENGYTVRGESSCVSIENFNTALGEKYAYEKAVDNLWPLEGYLLAEEIFQRSKA